VHAWVYAFVGEVGDSATELDAVPAVAEGRAVLWKRLSEASFISEDEARALAGLTPSAEQGEVRK